jgi:ABC-type branched-subunit amino acid transport system ATPase component/sugar phosphate permease
LTTGIQEPGRELAPETREPGFLKKGAASFRSTLREAWNYRELGKTPYGIKPLLIFAAIGAIQGIDVTIFPLAIREILRDVGSDIGVVFQVTNLIGFFVTFAILGVAILADRTRRVFIVGFGAIVSGIFSTLTSRAGGVWNLGLTRGADEIGDRAFSVPIGSLAADYYPPEHRGKAFAFWGAITLGFTLAAPLIVALLVTNLGWRPTFLISGAAMVTVGVLALLLLREPIRGYMDRKALGVSEEVAQRPEEPQSFGEAWRTIWSIRTLRRLFIADIPGSAASLIFRVFFPAVIFEKYGLSILEAGGIFFGLGLATLPSGFLAGGIVDVLLRRRPQRVLIFSGLLTLTVAIFVALLAFAPPLWLFVVLLMVYGSAATLLGPARQVLFAQIVPAHVRTLGLSVQVLASIPGNILRGFTVPLFLAAWGVQGGLFSVTPFLIVAGLIELSAAGFFERDMRAALASQLASQEYRRAKESGKGKLLVCRDVDVEYDGVQVLFGVDFDVEEGDIVALLGTNGAGKSTLLRAISGTQEASSGAIVFDGRDTTHMPPAEIARRGVTLMPGGRGIFPGLSVRRNLMLGNWINESKESEGRLREVYEMFPVLHERGNEKAGSLSGGEQQMLSLAQAFLSRPRLLMIDELSLGLSPALVQQLIEIVKKIHEQGTTIILVEQSVNVALTVAEKAIFMEKGEVKFLGKTADLLTRPDILRAIYVKGTGALTASHPTTLKSERERREYLLSDARNVLEVKEVSKTFGGVIALEDVSLHLREGEILGLIGPNGAGKTTLFDVISGYQSPDSGQVLYNGLDVTSIGPEDRAAAGIVRRFQDARLLPSLTVYENLLLALDRKLDSRNTVLIALQAPGVRKSERRVRLRADALIEILSLGDYRDKFVKELSTGLRRMVDLACVLATEPKVLMLDEPSTGIAQAEAESLGPLLRRIRVETSCSVLVIEHDMTLISSISDELVAMDQGRVLLRGAPEEVLNSEVVIQSYLGTSEEVIKRTGVLD